MISSFEKAMGLQSRQKKTHVCFLHMFLATEKTFVMIAVFILVMPLIIIR